MIFKPREHQERAINFALSNSYSILALDMGLGKTYCALSLQESTRLRTLIVCPAYLIPTWRYEISVHCEPSVVVSYFDRGSLIYPVWDSDVVVISYDLGKKAEQLMEWADLVIFDESTELKSMEAKRTEYYHRTIYENSTKRVHFLTGTPLLNGVYEYYSMLAMCYYSPEKTSSDFLVRFPDAIAFASYFSYEKSFTLEVGNKRVKILKWEGVRKDRIPELKSYLKDVYIRIKSEDVLDLPAMTEKNIFSSNEDDPELFEAFLAYYESGKADVNPTAKATAALRKVPFTIVYATQVLEQTGSVLIYSDHVESCKALAQHFQVPAVYGKLHKDKRRQVQKDFQSGKTSVICATYKSFSQGVDLTRSNNICLNDYPWTPGLIKQALYRIQRMNQTKPCFAHKIFGSPQDHYIYEKVMQKQKVIDAVT